jgi:hypothetical protein
MTNTMASTWPWIALVGLGAFHGLNPAMGWLFAVALALHRGSLAPVAWALPSIALGHAASVAVVVAAVLFAGVLIDPPAIRIAAGAGLIGWAGYHALFGHRHRVRVGMQAGIAGLILWSFTMATVHGAGLMVVPAVTPLCLSGGAGTPASGGAAVAAVAAHTAAMLTVIGAIAVGVYRWLGLAVLRSAWINLDLIWSAALLITGTALLFG